MPKVSVVIPTYNRAQFIPEVISSVLCQTLDDFELLIIDDGSTDNTKDIVSTFLSDPRVKYFYKDNGGEPSAVNYGWSLSTGEYFVQVNSDDPQPPDLFKEMCTAMDASPGAVVGYCDFNFIDEDDNVIYPNISQEWDFVMLLSQFSCLAAAPGTFIRKSAFHDWDKLRSDKYRYINDIDMFWEMALVGDFIHIPKVLANWRQHPSQLSSSNYKAIPEIIAWYNSYFSKSSLPKHILECKLRCKASIVRYCSDLLDCGDIPLHEMHSLRRQLDAFFYKAGYEYVNLQVGDNDLIGNKFNGHNLHLLLNDCGVNSFHIVRNKQSNDPKTIQLDRNTDSDYSWQILHSKEYIYSDIVHLHLIHNTNFDLSHLPLFTSLKPTVITLHDPFFLGGHCIYHGNCTKFENCCYDCDQLDTPFAIETDDSALRFEMKRQAFQASSISIIVASKWMEAQVKKSPVFEEKNVYLVPFGIDQSVFAPADGLAIRQELGIGRDSIVLMFRSDTSLFKGLNLIKDALRSLDCKRPVEIITVAQKGNLDEFSSKYKLHEFGWINDDFLLAKLYQACDLFLMPSTQEAFGMMAVEAMSCGKPVLTTLGTALPDVVNAPQCGIAVHGNEFASTLQTMLNAPEQLHIRGLSCLEYARENYGEAKYIERIKKVYTDTIANHTPCSRRDTVISQLATHYNVSNRSSNLYMSHSWKITAPLRALSAAHKYNGSFHRKVSFFILYLRRFSLSPVSDDVIKNSRSWALTAPLRKLKLLFIWRL